MLELTKTVEHRKLREQMLDGMDLERERGITIKAHPVTMRTKAGTAGVRSQPDRHPGHVDFSYEVARSLAACEGALLVVDAPRGWRRRRWPTRTWPPTRASNSSRC